MSDDQQRDKCAQYGAAFVAAPPHSKIGVARNVLERIKPLNGLRHPPTADTCGWYVWAGEQLSSDPDFFVPLHVEHLLQWCPDVLPFLGLGPGWRFLVDGAYEDAWEDGSLLNI